MCPICRNAELVPAPLAGAQPRPSLSSPGQTCSSLGAAGPLQSSSSAPSKLLQTQHLQNSGPRGLGHANFFWALHLAFGLLHIPLGPLKGHPIFKYPFPQTIFLGKSVSARLMITDLESILMQSFTGCVTLRESLHFRISISSSIDQA